MPLYHKTDQISTKTYLCFYDILKAVAQVLPSFLTVILIVAHAQPAELILALTACHVHAALVLLYGYLALGTRLSVELHPDLGVIAPLVDSIQPLN